MRHLKGICMPAYILIFAAFVDQKAGKRHGTMNQLAPLIPYPMYEQPRSSLSPKLSLSARSP